MVFVSTSHNKLVSPGRQKNATAAPAPSIASALYAYCAAARAFDGFHLDEGAAADAWLAACPAVARDERPETVAAALVNAERQAIAAGVEACPRGEHGYEVPMPAVMVSAQKPEAS